MAKYLDQAGAQHLAEALMNSTKTVGGQTIWGSGDIETSGGNNIKTYVIPGDAEWLENADALASYDFKVVYLGDETGNIGSTSGETYTLRNAIVFTVSANPFISIGGSNAVIEFINCQFVGHKSESWDDSDLGYCHIHFSNAHVEFINCTLYLSAIGVDTTGYASNLIFTNTCVYGSPNNPPHIDANSYVFLQDSSVLDGMFFENNAKITIYIQSQYNSFTRVIYHEFTRCLIGDDVTFTATGDTAKYVSFNQCDICSTSGVSQLYNVTNCRVVSGPDEWCHPSIFDNQIISNTADGGFNKIN